MLESYAGQALQFKLLSSFDPETVVSDDGTRAGERLLQLRQSQDEVLKVGGTDAWRKKAPTMDAAGWARYREILQSDGELAANRWLSEQK